MCVLIKLNMSIESVKSILSTKPILKSECVHCKAAFPHSELKLVDRYDDLSRGIFTTFYFLCFPCSNLESEIPQYSRCTYCKEFCPLPQLVNIRNLTNSCLKCSQIMSFCNGCKVVRSIEDFKVGDSYLRTCNPCGIKRRNNYEKKPPKVVIKEDLPNSRKCGRCSVFRDDSMFVKNKDEYFKTCQYCRTQVSQSMKQRRQNNKVEKEVKEVEVLS